jgi:hypothetical protein
MIERDLDVELRLLEADLRKLEAEYNMFFAGQLPRPPWETRRRVETIIRRWDRAYVQNYADRFRFNTLQARYAAFVELWDRGLRAREEGRPGPFSRPSRPPDPGAYRVLLVTTFVEPRREMEKLHELYERVMEARRETGEEAVPFHKFVGLVDDQVARLRKAGSSEVAFRVAVRDGAVKLTARALKGVRKPEE